MPSQTYNIENKGHYKLTVSKYYRNAIFSERLCLKENLIFQKVLGDFHKWTSWFVQNKPVLCWGSPVVEFDGCWPSLGNRGRIPISAVHDWCLGPMLEMRSASGGVWEIDRWGRVFSWLGEWSVPGKVLTWGMLLLLLLGEVTKGWWEGLTLTNTGELDSPSRIWVTSSEPPRRCVRPVNGRQWLDDLSDALRYLNPWSTHILQRLSLVWNFNYRFSMVHSSIKVSYLWFIQLKE